MVIREILVQDAENLRHLIYEVENNAEFMLMERGERKMTVEQIRKQIENVQQQNNSVIFVAEQEEELLGYLFAIGGNVKRKQHSAYLVIGILDDYRGKGVGTKLFQKVTDWAAKQQLTRLELTVVTQNEAGVALYRKSGFRIEGTKRNSLVINGKSYDEYYMAKFL